MFNPISGKSFVENDRIWDKLIVDGFKKKKINNIEMMVPPDEKLSEYIKLQTHYIAIKQYHSNKNTPVIYPNTGKKIKYETAKKKHLQFTIEYNSQDPTKIKMIPVDKSDYEKHIDNYWIKKGTKAFINAEKSDKILKKMVYAPNKKLIPINSKQANKLIKDGYEYDDKKNILLYPLKLHNAEVVYPCGASDLSFITNNNINKLSLTLDDDSIIDINMNTLTKIANTINKYLYYTSTKTGLIIGIEGGDEVKFGIAFDGEKNCVITALEKHMKKNNYDVSNVINALYTHFKHGVYGSDDYDYICKKLQLRIKVTYPPYGPDDYIKFGNKNNKQRAMFECRYQNYHISSTKSDNLNAEKKIIYFDELQWDKLIKEENVKLSDVCNIIGKMSDPACVETNLKMYKAKYVEFNESKLELQNAYTPIGHYTQIFVKNNPEIKPIHFRNFNINAIKSICQHGITISLPSVFPSVLPPGTQKNNTPEALYNYDIKLAYTTYKKCEYYSGFPTDLDYCINVEEYDIDRIKDILNKYEGFGMVKMTCLWSNEKVERWVSFPYIRHYMENRKDKLTIYYMMISTNKVSDVNRDGLDVTKRVWHYILGNISKTKRKSSYCTLDPLLAKTTKGFIEEFRLNDSNSEDVMIYRKSQEIPYISKNYYPHITGYVQNYTEIRLEQFVLDHNISGIKRVWVDGIYCTTDVSLDTDDELRKTKNTNFDKKLFEHCDGKIKYNVVEPIYFSYKLEERLPSGNVIVKGGAGTGKSYLLRNLYNQIPNSIVLVPTNELIKQFPSCNCVTVDNFMYHVEKFSKFSTVLIDEYSMVSQEKIDKVLENHNITRIIMFGDLKQLGLVIGTPINESQYTILKLMKNFRQHNAKFQKKLQQMRKDGKFKFKKKIDAKEALNKQFLILSSTHNDIDKLNEMGLVLNNNKLIDGLKIGAPIRFYKTCRNKKKEGDSKNNYNAGELGKIIKIDDNLTIQKENGEIVILKKSTFDKYHKLAYSVTYHAIQGKTVKNQNIAINTNRLFDKNMKYVGCSRVINEEQLYLLVGL